MSTFAQKYPFYMTLETARELLEISRRRRIRRGLDRSMRESTAALKRIGIRELLPAELSQVQTFRIADEVDHMLARQQFWPSHIRVSLE